MKKHIYHVRKREDLLQEGLIMKLDGLPSKGAHVGLLGSYNLYVDPELGVSKVMLRKIPCACAPCKEFIKRPWKPVVPEKYQPCFANNRLCSYWENFKDENGWITVQTNSKKGRQPTNIEQPQKEVLGWIMIIMAEKIKEQNYGAVMK